MLGKQNQIHQALVINLGSRSHLSRYFKDTVNVTVSVRKLSDEYAPTGNKIVRNQNVPDYK